MDPRSRTWAKFWLLLATDSLNHTKKEWAACRNSEFPVLWNCSNMGWITSGTEISSPGGLVNGIRGWQDRQGGPETLPSPRVHRGMLPVVYLPDIWVPGWAVLWQNIQRLKKVNHEMRSPLGPLKLWNSCNLRQLSQRVRWLLLKNCDWWKNPKWLTEMK